MDVSLILLSAAGFLAWLLMQKFLAAKNQRQQAKLRLVELLRDAAHSRSEHQRALAQIDKDLAALQERAVEMEQRLCAVMLLPKELPTDGPTQSGLAVAAQRPLTIETKGASRRRSAGKKVPAPRRKPRSAPVLLTDVVDDPAAYMANLNKETSRANGAAA